MKVDKAFPLALIVLSVGAGVTYFCTGDIRRGIYWVAAAILNICVTF
jgi:uncharacterized membrane protein